MYTGDVFMKSAAMDTLHGKAIQSVNDRWKVSDLDHNVCKNKYTPFVTTKHTDPITGRVSMTVTRTYGCHFHSDLRKKVIEKYGERRGWEPFGQWSLLKACRVAKKLTNNLDNKRDQNNSNNNENKLCYVRPIGANGSCVWKVKSKYDDIMEELSEQKQQMLNTTDNTTNIIPINAAPNTPTSSPAPAPAPITKTNKKRKRTSSTPPTI